MPFTISGAAVRARTAVATYRPGQSTPCPACGERQWLVGRIMAQCACCDTALPIDTGYRGWNGMPAQPAPLEQLPVT